MDHHPAPEIERYTDYRAYLRDYYAHAKAAWPHFSYRWFNRKAGISNPALYGKVVDGERNLTEKTAAAFAKGLKLGDRQARFFQALVRFNQAKTVAVKQECLERMRGLLPRVQERALPADVYAYYSRWHHIALRELICLLDWKEDFGLLARHLVPEIPRRVAKESVEFLLAAGLVKQRPDGRYAQAWPHVSTGSEVDSLAVREANRQMGALGLEALDRVPPSQRDVSSLTLGLSAEEFSLVKSEIRYFKDRVRAIVAGPDWPEKVYSLNVQFFPLSRAIGGEAA